MSLMVVDEKTNAPVTAKAVRGALKVNGAAGSLVAVTPSDDDDIAGSPAIGLWVGGAGDIAIIAENDTAPVTITAVAAGTYLPIRAKRVMATNTDATVIVALI